jgi:hypothetical protein
MYVWLSSEVAEQRVTVRVLERLWNFFSLLFWNFFVELCTRIWWYIIHFENYVTYIHTYIHTYVCVHVCVCVCACVRVYIYYTWQTESNHTHALLLIEHELVFLVLLFLATGIAGPPALVD